jgi:hypothetical protein
MVGGDCGAPKGVPKRHPGDLQATAALLSKPASAVGNGESGTRPENPALQGHFPDLSE